MSTRAIDCLVNVHFGETAKQPEFMLKVRDDYFKGPKSLYEQVELPQLLDEMDEQGVELPGPLGGGRPARVPAVPGQRRRRGRVADRAADPDRRDGAVPPHPQERRARGPLRHAEVAQQADQHRPRQRRRRGDLRGAEDEPHEAGSRGVLCVLPHDRIR